MNMMNVDLFVILFPVHYLKEILTPPKISFWSIQWTLDNLFGGWGVGYTWVAGSEFRTGESGGQQRNRKCLEVQRSDLVSICQGPGLKESLDL